MSANEEQLEQMRAHYAAKEAERKAKHEAFVAGLLEAYREAVDRACAAWPSDKPFDPIEAMRVVDEAAVLAVAERALRVHAADLHRITCDLNAALIGPARPEKHGQRNTFTACAAVGAMRRLRARMRGKAAP